MKPVKRSFAIAGHRTSVSLEPAFWAALKEVAEVRNVPASRIVAEIDRERGASSLSSAIRVWLLAEARKLPMRGE